MSITTVDDIVAGLASAQDIDFIKNLTAPKAAGAFQSGWMAPGFPGAGAASPLFSAGAGYTCDRTTVGSMPYVNGAVQNWLARLAASCSQPGTIILYDRLWICSGLGSTTAGITNTITTPGNLPARITDNGADVEAWLENFVASGASAGTVTFNYLNANTGAAKSGVFTPVSAAVTGQLQPIPLAAGDTGVRSPVSVVYSATITSGSQGLTLMKPLARIPVLGVALGEVQDWAKLGLPKIPADACLMAVFLAQNTTAPVIIGTMDIIDK